MRRYLFDLDTDKIETEQYDVLVIGSGIAGLYSAMHIDPDKRCALITKVGLEKSNSWLAQGGIAAVIAPDDNFDAHIEDTLRAGAGLCNLDAVRVLVAEGPENIRELVELDVPFDTNPEGELLITREGGHSCRRIVHCGGDATGRETTRRLGEIVLEQRNITPMFSTYLIDILTDGNRVIGALVFDGKPKILLSPSIILATGGIGYLYQYTTNPRGAVGDGIAAACRAGAVIENMEMVQFHPTTLISPEHSERLFLISEAVRGEGGILKNHAGEAFMESVHPMKDLAPRDIVTRAILAELERTGEDHVFLDVSSMDEDFFSHRFPTIFHECRSFEINVPEDKIPVRPAQHYLMGGIKTDLDGMTNIDGLYACGEASSTGIHGANRLASNSVLECLVFGRRAARHINRMNRKGDAAVPKICIKETRKAPLSIHTLQQNREMIRQTMTQYAGAIRSTAGLETGLAQIASLREQLDETALDSPAAYELYNMAQTAELILRGACARKVSVGAHYLIDEKDRKVNNA